MTRVQCQLQFIEDLFSYQKVPFENFCDLQFCCKLRYCEFFDGLLHISCFSWEIKNDMSGQSKDWGMYVRVCNVKIIKSLPEQKWGTSSGLFGLVAPSVEQSDFFS